MPKRSREQGGRWGIMGGAFDPIHYGHLRLAENAREKYDLDGILFVVGLNPPHRDKTPTASFEDRCRMVSLGLKDNDDFILSEIEKTIAEPHYTINLINVLNQKYTRSEFYLILGGDNIAIFDSWYEPQKVVENTNVVAGIRPGYEKDMETSPWAKFIDQFEMQPLDISSTQIREFIKSNRSVRYLLPEPVRQYIIDKGLYQ